MIHFPPDQDPESQRKFWTIMFLTLCAVAWTLFNLYVKFYLDVT